ncbi:MAG: hypothetical protein H6Q80_408 [Deltaproteobacteria bacterium]|jgi:glycosyltransferase involved in cell wall biosynthesis|nr:hypothetical protein [Deltaproteobacteria bacterium]
MSDPPRHTVSVVTPSFNQGAFIGETIESVLGQEGDFSLDYVVVDGASTDDSVEVIRRYESLLDGGKWPIRCRGIRYRWVSEKDRGQADAIAKGFRMAEGEILAWLNSDDTYLPGAIARAVDLFDREPDAQAVFGMAHFTDEKGGGLGKYPTGPFGYRELATFNFVCQPSTFFRRSAFEAVGGLDTGLRYVMDYDLWIRMAARYRFAYLPELLSTYRLHTASKTMAAGDASANHEEALRIVMTHYGWAPANRVFAWCHHRLKSKLPPSLADAGVLLVPFSLLAALWKYLRLNRAVRREDLYLLRPRYVRKLFQRQIDIYRDY